MPNKNDRSFAPLVDNRSRILILGSFPGRESLKLEQYYANKNNVFWKLLAGALGCPVPVKYSDKIKMLCVNRVALWDVVFTCRRENSSDAKIKNTTPNDVPGMLKRYCGIKAIFFNGRAAESIFNEHFKDILNKPVHCLPSTSPANASLTYKTKYRAWQKIVKYL